MGWGIPDPSLHCRAAPLGLRIGAMERVTVYHNPACGKSRGALEILGERGVESEVIEYLKTPLDRAGLERVLGLLGGEPAALVRKDKRFKELGLDAGDYTTVKQVVDLLLAHPELMERPVVIRGRRAVIARPSERVLEILD
jgi:arsenate reductase (glutaredoxin)